MQTNLQQFIQSIEQFNPFYHLKSSKSLVANFVFDRFSSFYFISKKGIFLNLFGISAQPLNQWIIFALSFHFTTDFLSNFFVVQIQIIDLKTKRISKIFFSWGKIPSDELHPELKDFDRLISIVLELMLNVQMLTNLHYKIDTEIKSLRSFFFSMKTQRTFVEIFLTKTKFSIRIPNWSLR